MPNLTNYPYHSVRRVVMGQRGAVATSQPLATIAGMEMLLAGGNAVDAAIAMAIALTVVEPTSNGIGGDAFALVWDGKLHGLNASGKSPQYLTPELCSASANIPLYGWLSVTVPGAISGWRCLWEKWGKLPFEQLFEPAIRYAAEGFPVSPVTAQAWQRAEVIYLPLVGAEFEPFKQVFFPQHRAPVAGEVWRSEVHAQTLREIASSGGESFYRGEIARAITAFADSTGGLLTTDDLANHQADWVEPIATDYRGVTVWELPPNTQGIATLLALNILENFDLAQYPRESAASYHLQIEAIKLAFADVYRYVGDARFLEIPVELLLNKTYARVRQQLIGETAISQATYGLPSGGTVYLAACDRELMVSFIQSNYQGFGSGILIPDTGIALQNRAAGFNLLEGHPNQVGAAKRPFHTIIPGFLSQNGQPIGPFGVMGASMQPQGHLQVVVNQVDYGMNPQAALDAPRWHFVENNTVLLEPTVPQSVGRQLSEQYRHHIFISSEQWMFGKGQIICQQNGVFTAASEPRADGMAIAF